MELVWDFLSSWNWRTLGDWGSFTLAAFGAWFGWYSFLLKGSRVKVRAKPVIHLNGAILDADFKKKDDFPYDFLDGNERPVLYVRARNSGRSPIEVESVELESRNGSSKPFTPGFDSGLNLPYRLEPGSSGNWMFNLQSALAVSTYRASEKPNSVRAVIKLANDKTVKSKYISAQSLSDYISGWNDLHK
jgi:hypothetical protein